MTADQFLKALYSWFHGRSLHYLKSYLYSTQNTFSCHYLSEE